MSSVGLGLGNRPFVFRFERSSPCKVLQTVFQTNPASKLAGGLF